METVISNKKGKKVGFGRGWRIFNIFNIFILIIVSLIFIMPYWMIIVASLSDESTLITQGYGAWFRGFSFDAYKYVFTANDMLMRAISNSIKYTVLSSIAVVMVSTLYAYPLTCSSLKGKKFLSIFFIIPMFFGGGIVPTFLIVSTFFYDSTWAMVIPGCCAPFYVILIRNYMYSIPPSLIESAKIDGASDWRIFFKIIFPLSLPVLATIFLYGAISMWNNWLGPLLYLADKNKYPLQYFIQQIMININSMYQNNSTKIAPVETVKMACVIVASLPMIAIYPFIQKYFIQGTNLGAVKE